MGDLEIHIHDSQIIVNARGTRLTVTYQISPDRQSLVEQPFWTSDDRNAPMSLDEFRRSACVAARRRAREIGWIQPSHSSEKLGPTSLLPSCTFDARAKLLDTVGHSLAGEDTFTSDGRT